MAKSSDFKQLRCVALRCIAIHHGNDVPDPKKIGRPSRVESVVRCVRFLRIRVFSGRSCPKSWNACTVRWHGMECSTMLRYTHATVIATSTSTDLEVACSRYVWCVVGVTKGRCMHSIWCSNSICCCGTLQNCTALHCTWWVHTIN